MVTKYRNRIVIDQKVMVGKPVVRGTRITVELILRQLAQGITIREVLRNYPHLKKADVYAAIEYAAQLVEEETVYPFRVERYARTKTPVR